MKRYFMKSSVMLMAVSAALASCTQDEMVKKEVSTHQALNISVTTQDFVSEDGSRATTGTDENRTTAFAEGDEMGMYVISSDGTVLCNNEKFVYTASAWKAENELYFWKNADYIVYYPYNADLTAENVTTIEDIKTKFAESADFYTQNTAEAYEKADLMLAEVTNPENGNIAFELAHQFSMVEINVPVRRYVTSEAQGSFEYTAPVSLEWESPLKIGEQTVTPYSAGKGSFRFIVPSATDLSLTLDGRLMYDEGVPVYFGSSTETQSINLTSGTCKVYNVTYDKVSSESVIRDLEVGDYYYSDGSIYPYGNQEGDNDESKPVKDGCIGVVFSCNVNAEDTPNWKHGYVVALKNDYENVGKNGPQWGNATLSDNVIDGTDFGNSEVTAESETGQARTALLQLKNGYAITYQLLTKFGDEAIAATNAVKFGSLHPEYAAPVEISSGWFMPSVGQMYELLCNLGEISLDAEYKWFTEKEENDKKVAALQRIIDKIQIIDSSITWDKNAGDWRIRLCNEAQNNTEGKATSWTIDWINNWIRFYGYSKEAQNAYVRPILAF